MKVTSLRAGESGRKREKVGESGRKWEKAGESGRKRESSVLMLTPAS